MILRHHLKRSQWLRTTVTTAGLLLLASSLLAATPVDGFWTSVDQDQQFKTSELEMVVRNGGANITYRQVVRPAYYNPCVTSGQYEATLLPSPPDVIRFQVTGVGETANCKHTLMECSQVATGQLRCLWASRFSLFLRRLSPTP